MTGFWEAIDGFQEVPPDEYRLQWKGEARPDYPRTMSYVVGGKLRPKRRLAGEEARFLKDHAPGPFKITLPGAHMIGGFGFRPGLTEPFYASRQELLRELGGILRDEIAALMADGVPCIQLDAPGYAMFVDEGSRAVLHEAGANIDRLIDEAIEADNVAVHAWRERA